LFPTARLDLAANQVVSAPPPPRRFSHAELQPEARQVPHAPEYWTIAEAEDYVRRYVGCSRGAARKLVRGVLTDAAIRGDLLFIIVWESLVEGLSVGELPPFHPEYWRKVRIRGAKVYDPYGNCWRTLWVRREAILQHWPQVGMAARRVSESGSIRAAQKPVSDADLKNWYATRVREWPADKNTPSEAQDVSDAKAAFPNHLVSRDRVRALRASEAPTGWKRPVRKSRG
jgi:hypothetical protein